MRLEPIRDPDGDRILAQEQAARALERGDSPKTHLYVGPLERCSECGYLPREVSPGNWNCPCDTLGLIA